MVPSNDRWMLSCWHAESSLRWAFSHLGIGGTNIEAVSECRGLARDFLVEVQVSIQEMLDDSAIFSSKDRWGKNKLNL